MTDSHDRDSHVWSGSIARATPGDGLVNTVDLRWEDREILYFQGFPYTNEGLRERRSVDLAVPGHFGPNPPPKTPHTNAGCRQMQSLPLVMEPGGSVFHYRSEKQRVNYTVRISTDRVALRNALETPGAFVFYAGHARWGRGPLFGPANNTPGEFTESANTPPGIGLFRMGYPVGSFNIADIYEFKYKTRPILHSEPLRIEECNPFWVRRYFDRFRGRRIRDLDADLLQYVEGLGLDDIVWSRIKSDIRNVRKATTDEMTAIMRAERAKAHPTIDPKTPFSPDEVEASRTEKYLKELREHKYILARAGWEHTGMEAARMDLGSVDIRCRAFVMVACAGMPHFKTPLRSYKHWTVRPDDRLFYSLDNTGTLDSANFMLYHMLTYPYVSGRRRWEPWLDYAADRSNEWIKLVHPLKFRIVRDTRPVRHHPAPVACGTYCSRGTLSLGPV